VAWTNHANPNLPAIPLSNLPNPRATRLRVARGLGKRTAPLLGVLIVAFGAWVRVRAPSRQHSQVRNCRGGDRWGSHR